MLKSNQLLIPISLLTIVLLFTNGCIPQASTAEAPLDGSNLKLIWQQNIDTAIQRAPLQVKDIALVITSEGTIEAFNLDNGKPRWQFNTPATLLETSITTTQEGVLIGGENGRLLALTTQRGIVDWDIDLDANVQAPPLAARYLAFVPTVVQSTQSHASLYAVGIAKGEILWQFKTDQNQVLTPAWFDDSVYAISTNGKSSWLYAIKAEDGSEKWQVQMEQTPSQIVAASENSIAVLGETAIMGFDAATGALRWQETSEADWLLHHNDTLVTGNGEGNFQAREIQSGELIWEKQLDSSAIGIPTIITEELYMLSDKGVVTALSVQDGVRIWQYPTEVANPAGMAVSQGWLLITSTDGELFAYQATE